MLGANRTYVNQTGFSKNTVLVPSINNGITYAASLANPFPSGFTAGVGAALGLATYTGNVITFSPRTLKTPYTQRWQLSVQHEVMRSTVLEIAYVGMRGVRLLDTRQADPIPRQYLSTLPVRDQQTINALSAQVTNPFYPILPGTGLAAANVSLSQLLMPYPEFTGISYSENRGYGWYHALQTRVERRLSAGLTANFAWTWSKNREAATYLNATDPGLSRAISALDRTHNVRLTTVYQLPFGSGRKWMSSANRGIRGIVSGWQSQLIFYYQSGTPLGFGDAIFNGDLHDIELPGDKRTQLQWFNTSLFNTNPSQQLASNIITMPLRLASVRDGGLNSWDASLIKNTRIREKLTLQFRAESTDVFNHPTFAAPNTTPSSAAFGSVTSENQWPRVIQFAVKVLF
jgi:hypothetical protein